MNRFQHRIADIVFQTTASTSLPGLHTEPFAGFSVREKKADVHHFICEVAHDGNRSENDPCGGWTSVGNESTSAIVHCSRVRSRLERLDAKVDAVKVSVGSYWAFIRDYRRNLLEIYYMAAGDDGLEKDGAGSEYLVAANYRQIFSTFLPKFSAVLLHSSGVIRNDKAAIFLAPDEGGKTTAALMSQGSPILSGDQVILCREKGEFFAHGTPLGGMTGGPIRALAGGLFVLKKSPSFRLSPLSPQRVLQNLWNEHRNYTFFLPRDLKKRAFQILSDLCFQVPGYEMAFPEGFVGWEEVDAAMNGGPRNGL